VNICLGLNVCTLIDLNGDNLLFTLRITKNCASLFSVRNSFEDLILYFQTSFFDIYVAYQLRVTLRCSYLRHSPFCFLESRQTTKFESVVEHEVTLLLRTVWVFWATRRPTNINTSKHRFSFLCFYNVTSLRRAFYKQFSEPWGRQHRQWISLSIRYRPLDLLLTYKAL